MLDSGSSPATDFMWVDFAHTGVEAGTQSNPFNTLGEVLPLVDSGGMVTIRRDSTQPSSSETLTIDQLVVIESLNGPVRIGVAPPQSGFIAGPRRR